MAWTAVRSKVVGSVVVDQLFNVLPIVCGSSVFVFCFSLLNVHSNFAKILKRKRKLAALLLLYYIMYFCGSSSWCRGLVFCVIVVFPDHTHFMNILRQKS